MRTSLRIFLSILSTIACAALSTAPAAAQFADFGGGPMVLEGPVSPASAAVSGDFDGDGYDDYAAGLSTAPVAGIFEAGQVSISYGSSDGVNGPFPRLQLLHEAVDGIPGAPGVEHLFGHRLAVGDFDGDLYTDIAITVSGAARSHNVTVVFGSQSGLDPRRTQQLEGGADSTLNLAAGDFNGDGLSDLAIAAPRGKTTDGSELRVYYGTDRGLDRPSATSERIQDITALLGHPSRVDWLGHTMAVGDFEGDGFDDLALGAPSGFNITVTHGWLILVRGSAFGLERKFIYSGSEINQSFATKLAVGDLNGDGRDDVVASVTPSGRRLHLYYGRSSGGVDGRWSSLIPGFSPGAIAMADLNDDGFDDLVASEVASRSLLVAKGIDVTSPRFDAAYQAPPLVEGFGRLLTLGNFDGGGLDLVASVLPQPASPNDRALQGLVVRNERVGPPAGIRLQQERFEVTVRWRDFQDNTGWGRPVRQSGDSAVFYFFQSRNWELLIKVLNGCPLNQHYWTFLAATTDVEFEVEVTDLLSGVTKFYSNPLGQSANAVTDTRSFATCS